MSFSVLKISGSHGNEEGTLISSVTIKIEGVDAIRIPSSFIQALVLGDSPTASLASSDQLSAEKVTEKKESEEKLDFEALMNQSTDPTSCNHTDKKQLPQILTYTDLEKISQFITPQLDKLKEFAKMEGGAHKISRRHVQQLPFPVTILEDGKAIVHGKNVLGKGEYGIVKGAVELFSGKNYARKILLHGIQYLKNEVAAFEKLKGVKGIVQGHPSILKTKKKNGKTKISILMDQYS